MRKNIAGTGDKNEGLAMLIRRSAFRDIEARARALVVQPGWQLISNWLGLVSVRKC